MKINCAYCNSEVVLHGGYTNYYGCRNKFCSKDLLTNYIYSVFYDDYKSNQIGLKNSIVDQLSEYRYSFRYYRKYSIYIVDKLYWNTDSDITEVDYVIKEEPILQLEAKLSFLEYHVILDKVINNMVLE